MIFDDVVEEQEEVYKAHLPSPRPVWNLTSNRVWLVMGVSDEHLQEQVLSIHHTKEGALAASVVDDEWVVCWAVHE